MRARVPMRFIPLLIGMLLCTLLAVASSGSPRAETTPPPGVTFTGESGDAEDTFGWAIAAAGDVNDDGIQDVLIGAPTCDEDAGFAGRAYLFHGPLTPNMAAANADAIITPEAFGDNLGVAVAGAGDLNSDGFDDILIGARGHDAPGIQSGRVYLFLGPVEGELAATEADAIISGSDFEELGWSVAPAGDLNDDGIADIAIGAHKFSGSGGDERGRAYVFFGPIAGQMASSSADAIITGEFGSDHFGTSVACAGDVNGDEMDDLIVGAPHAPLGFVDPGRAYVFFGPVSGAMSAGAANVILRGDTDNDLFGTSVATAGDVNNDGFADVIVGSEQTFNQGPGRAHIFHGPLVETVTGGLVPANATLIGEVSQDAFGRSAASAGDLNEDGLDDVIVGAWNNGAGGGRAGRAYVFLSPTTGTNPAASADMLITGAESGDRFGFAVAPISDLDGSGRPDLLIGAPQFPEGTPGKAYVFHDRNVIVGIEGPPGELSMLPEVRSAPNPFRATTSVAYSIPTAGPARITIYDLNGRLVRTLVDGWEPAGERSVVWDGTIGRAARAAAGVYVVRLETGDATRHEKVFLLR